MNLFLGIGIFVLNFSLGLFVLLKKRRLTNIIFGLFAISFGAWALTISLTLSTPLTLLWGRLAFLTAIFGIGFIFLFSLVFPENRKLSLPSMFLIFSPALILGFASLTDLMIKSASVQNNVIIGTFGPLMNVYQFFAPIYIFGSLLILLRKYWKVPHTIQRLQLKYAFLGIGLFVGPAVLTNAVLPLWFDIHRFNPFGPFFSIFMVAFVSYAIVKHRLMDINVVLQRGIVYTSLLAVIVGFYLTIVSFLGYLFQQTTNTTILASAGLTTLIGIFAVPTIEKYFSKVTDGIFFKDRYDYSKAMHELSEILNKTLDLQTISEKVSLCLQRTFKTGKVYFIPRSYTSSRNEEWFQALDGFYSTEQAREHKIIVHSEIPNLLQDSNYTPVHRGYLLSVQEFGKQHEISITIPIVLKRKVMGAVNMGRKLSGDPYTKEDLDLLRTFCYQAAVALEKAVLYEKLKHYSRKLEERVRERTTQIQQLQEEQKQMMIDISHGLQTPLTIMKGELGLLQEQMEHERKFSTLEKSIGEVSKFIYDLLHLAQLEAGQEDFVKEPLNFSTFLTDLVEYFKILAKEKDIIIISAIEPGIIISGNKDKLEELVTNLVSNATKYIANEKKIYIVLRKKDGLVELIVQDTGVGIRNEDIPHIFNRFYRTRDARTKGVGLGLAICKKIVEQHGGTIHVKSEFKKGTRLTIRFEKTGS